MSFKFTKLFITQLFFLFNCTLVFSQPEPLHSYHDQYPEFSLPRQPIISRAHLNIDPIRCLSFPSSVTIQTLGCQVRTPSYFEDNTYPRLQTPSLGIIYRTRVNDIAVVYSPTAIYAMNSTSTNFIDLVDGYPQGRSWRFLFYPTLINFLDLTTDNGSITSPLLFEYTRSRYFVNDSPNPEIGIPFGTPIAEDYVYEPASYHVNKNRLVISVQARRPSSNGFGNKQLVGGFYSTMAIPIINQNYFNFIDISHTLMNRDVVIQACVNSYYTGTCTNLPPARRYYLVVGYAIVTPEGYYGPRNMDMFDLTNFPLMSGTTIRNSQVGLIGAVVEVENNSGGVYGNSVIISKNVTWDAETNTLAAFGGHRRLLSDKNINVIERVNSGEEFLHQPGHLVSFVDDDDSDPDNDLISHYTLMNDESDELELRSMDGTIKNTLKVNPKDKSKYHTFRVSGRQLQSVAKGETIDKDEVVYSYGKDCLGSLDENSNYLTTEGNDLVMRTPEKITWRKLSAQDDVTCSFPTEGPSSIGDKNWIQYNQSPDPNKNELTYFLSDDGSKITIKIGNTLKVIDKSQFNGNYESSPAVQTFNLN